MASEVNKQENSMKFILFISLLFGNSLLANAQQFEAPVIITPAHPMVGDVIKVGVFNKFFPPCLNLPQFNQEGLSHLFVQSQNDISLYVVDSFSLFCFPFPVTPAPREYYELGSLPAGNYKLTTYAVDKYVQLPLPDNYPEIIPFGYGYLTFAVTEPEIIQTNTNFGLLILIASLIFLTYFFKNKFILQKRQI